MARVLVVEDDADILTLIVHKLEQAGHDVTARTDGPAGLATAREIHPELIVLDWMVPGMNGLEICEAIRQDPAISVTPIMMLTAKAQAVDIETAQQAGADDFIVKPFSSRVLVQRVGALLDRP